MQWPVVLSAVTTFLSSAIWFIVRSQDKRLDRLERKLEQHYDWVRDKYDHMARLEVMQESLDDRLERLESLD